MTDSKPIIAPLQNWLLGQGRCVGCGRLLASGKKQPQDGIFLVTCDCRRVFIYQPEQNFYRRALFSEV